MSTRFNIAVLLVILLAILSKCQKCQKGQVLIHKNCVSCTLIKNTKLPETLSAPVHENQCACKQGFLWSKTLSECSISFAPPLKQNRILLDQENILIKAEIVCNTSSQYFNPGLNKCVCDQTKNYAPMNNSCIRCAQAEFSNGFANELGCVCRNGRSWSSISGQCLCPSGSVFIGDACVSCASTKLPTGVVVADCNSCSNSKGFVSIQKLGCFLCSSQNGAGTAVSNGSCVCTGKGQIWKPLKGSCSCDWSQLYVTSVNSTGGFSCQKCPYIMSGNSNACPCGISFLQHDPTNQICTDISTDPNQNAPADLNTKPCKQGFRINNKKYPYKCTPGYNASVGYFSSAAQSYSTCSSSSNPTACASCDLTAGYLLIVDTNECLLCSTVTGSTGVALSSGCVCQAGRLWNSIALTCDVASCAAGTVYQPNSKLCICDPIKSIKIGSNCILCSSIPQSNGYAATTTSCGCISPLFWVGNATGGLCTNTTCNLATQIILNNGSCFTCPTLNGLGKSNGIACLCNANFIWSPTLVGGSCICDYTKAYSIGAKCTLCSLDSLSTGAGDGKGGCTCKTSSAWVASTTTSSCKSCNTQPNIILLANGTCFTCGANGTFTGSKVNNAQNNSCSCTSSTLLWNSTGFCDCGPNSIMVVSGNTFICYKCNNASAYTSAKIDSYTCSCTTNNLKWNPNTKSCNCADGSSIINKNGLTPTCFSCVVGGSIVGVSADQTACLCIGDLIWLPSSMNCGCSDSSKVMLGSGVNTQCVSCTSIKYGKAAISSSSCSCLGSGLAFNASCSGSCDCPADNIILPNFTCFSCPLGSSPLTPYQCLCPPGSIWSYGTQGCVQCGSASLPNSLSSGATNFACLCNNNFIWNVMSQSCDSAAACSGAGCMKCPSGSASSLKAASARNLKGGSLVQALLNGSFTNYNLIKEYQCPCSSGYSWDSLRLRCFSTGLL